MDWHVRGDRPEDVGALRREVGAYLTRHGDGAGGVAEAELIVAEVVANAIRHAGGPVWVHLSWLSEKPTLVVRDLGPGFTLAGGEGDDPPASGVDVGSLAEGGRGLAIVSHLAPQLGVAARRAGGACVEVTLPVTRAPARVLDAPSSGTEELVAPDTTLPEGLGREAFLRSLVVHLAQMVEADQGPDVAEAMVARVGMAMGQQMESASRAATGHTGRLDPAQVAASLVDIKRAIGGGFSVVEADEERIVLVNTHCPFGDAVRSAPALCRMTSAVFGGIAARNRDDGAAVVLEERIAVGDPGCRVVVYLGDPPEESRRFADRYPSPGS